ncbi:non-homologous end joining protein Ku [Nocardiopsis halophila]|uniref:non-homologous end joining protein Ku n=1 Tax=Nocardiopsis halophila TaxID=141692 RepID=UPI000349867B|nr:Ku protein [Nocardiopsis halophila]
MVNPVWTGTLTFGMVSLSVRLYSARERHGPVMHQFQRGTSDRIRYKRVNERTGGEVPKDDIVRGARVDEDDGEDYVVLEAEDLESILPARSRAMEIRGFVPERQVDPLWYSATYFVSPRERASAKPYRLLCAALERTGRLGLATFIMRDREHLVLVGPQQGVLSASTLWWPDEVRDPRDVMPPVSEAELSDSDLGLAEQLVEAMATDWEPSDYSDDYERRLEELIEAKSKGRTITYQEEEPQEGSTVVELTDALRKSLKERRQTRANGGKGSGGNGSKGARAPKPRRGNESEADGAPSSPKGATKKELLKEAGELGVQGRSKMSRDQLAEAVEEARNTSARAAR